MKVVCRMWICFAVSAASLANGDTNDLSLRYEPIIPQFEDLEKKKPSTFWELFEQALDERTERTFTDRLHPLKVLTWNYDRTGGSWQDIIERGNRRMQSSLSRSIEYSLRDAAVGLPFVTWLEDRQEMLTELFVSSVDAVEEEAVAPLDPAYRPSERRWWEDLAQKRAIRYGIRPFRADPYSFLSVRFQEGDRLHLLGHVRYHFKDFSDHRFELAVSLPLANGLSFDVGTAYQFGQNEEEKKIVLKIFKPLPRGGIVHIGAEVQKNPTMFAGFSIPL